MRKVKKYAKTDKIKLNKDNIRVFAWLCFQRFKHIVDYHELKLDIDDLNNYFEKNLVLKKLNLKSKKY